MSPFSVDGECLFLHVGPLPDTAGRVKFGRAGAVAVAAAGDRLFSDIGHCFAITITVHALAAVGKVPHSCYYTE